MARYGMEDHDEYNGFHSKSTQVTKKHIVIFSIIAIAIVFTILALIITICGAFSKGIEIVDKKTKILPREENALLEKDQDAVVASLVATIEFNKEFKKDARLVSIKRED